MTSMLMLMMFNYVDMYINDYDYDNYSNNDSNDDDADDYDYYYDNYDDDTLSRIMFLRKVN